MELKKTDLLILSTLTKNSRKSNREIAKELKISKETVSNRINYLIENNYIKAFSLKINYEKLGFNEYNLFIKFKKINSEILENLILFFEKNENVTWIGKCFGKYDLKIALIFKNISEINKIIKDISSKYGTNLEIIDSIYIVDKYKAEINNFFKDLLLDNNLYSKNEKITSNLSKNKVKIQSILDDVDKNIVYELGQDPKKSYVQLANLINLTAEGIKNRIKKLQENEIILGNSIVINGNKFNKIWCLVLLNVNSEKNDLFKKYLKNQKYLSSYSESIGYWNFNVTFFASNIEELYNDLNNIRNIFAENIRNIDFLIFFDIYKFPKVPKCILKSE